MPVIAEALQTPNEQEWLDLEKLYQDYPEHFRVEELRQLLSANPATRLYVARFNDRILGALTLTVSGNNHTLDHLCVRTVTRRRGVARDLLRQMLAAAEGSSFLLNSCREEATLEALLNPFGFVRQGNQFLRTP